MEGQCKMRMGYVEAVCLLVCVLTLWGTASVSPWILELPLLDQAGEVKVHAVTTA